VESVELTRLLETAASLRERMARDGKRIDDLSQAVRDETWHARASEAAPDGEEEREFARRAAEIDRTLEEEIGRLSTHLRSGTERTGT